MIPLGALRVLYYKRYGPESVDEGDDDVEPMDPSGASKTGDDGL